MLTQDDFLYIDEVIQQVNEDARYLNKVYLSGPVSKFNDDAVAAMIFNTYKVMIHEQLNKPNETSYIVNPVEFNMKLPSYRNGITLDWGDFMTIDLMLLSQCKDIYMLPEWTESSGANCEYRFAKLNNINVHFL